MLACSSSSVVLHSPSGQESPVSARGPFEYFFAQSWKSWPSGARLRRIQSARSRAFCALSKSAVGMNIWL
jgi:hypothetical protein